MSKLDNINIGMNALSGEIYLFRHGKDKGLALDKRQVTSEVITTAVQHMMHDFPTGSKADVTIGDKVYEITVKPK